MALDVKDAAGSTKSLKTTEAAGVHTPHHIVEDGGGSLTVDVASLPLPTGAATETTLAARLSEADFDSKVGALTETAPTTDTASSGLNGRLQRLAQRLTSLLGLLPSALTGSGNFKVALNESSVAVAVTDNSSSLTVDDGGGSLTVDGAVSVSNFPASQAVSDGGGSLTVDGAVSVSNFPATQNVADGGGSLTVDNAGTFAVQDTQVLTDNTGFTDGATKVQPVGFVFDEVAGTALTENDSAAARVDAKRAQVLVIEDETTRGRRATVTAANALKVDASGAPIPVTDNGGSLTVDGAVSVSNFPATQAVSDGGGSLTVDGTVGIAGTVAVTDNSGSLTIDSADLGVTTEAEATGNGSVIAILKRLRTLLGSLGLDTTLQAIRDRLPSSLVSGRLDVNVGNTVAVDVTPGSPAASDYLPVRLTDGSAFYAAGGGGGGGDGAINDGASSSIKATVLDYTSSNPLAVRLTDTNGDYVSASGAGTQYSEDDASPLNPTGSMLIGRRRDTLSSEVSADGDNVALNATDKGELYVKQVDAQPVTDNGGSLTVDGAVSVSNFPATQAVSDGGGSLTVDGAVSVSNFPATQAVSDGGGSLTVDGTVGIAGSVAVTNATASNFNAQVVGEVAHDAVDSGNPQKIGGVARSSEQTAVANADRVNAAFDLVGKQIVLPYANPENFVSGTGSATGTADTAVIAAGGAGLRNYITSIFINNSSATNTFVNIKDGTTTLLVIPAPANSGAVIALPVPLRGSVNTALNFASAAGVTTMNVSAVGYRGV